MAVVKPVKILSTGSLKQLDVANNDELEVAGFKLQGGTTGTVSASSAGDVIIKPGKSSVNPALIVRNFTSDPAGTLMQVQDAAGANLFSVDETGDVAIAGNLQVTGTETITSTMSALGDVNLGDGTGGDSITINSRGGSGGTFQALIPNGAFFFEVEKASGADTAFIQLDPDGGSNPVQILVVDGDPSAGAGVAAPQGSIALDYTGALWMKTGAGDTNWSQAGTATGNSLQQAYVVGNTITATSGEGNIAFTLTSADFTTGGTAAADTTGNAVTLAAATGGAASAGAAGAGGAGSLAGGTGGAAADGFAAGTGGGALLSGGTGGVGSEGGSPQNGANGGAVTITAGDGGASTASTTGGTGGTLTLDAGAGGAGPGTGGADGVINLGTTDAATITIGNGTDTAVDINAGAASAFTVDGAGLTLETTTSGTLTVSSAGALDMDGSAVTVDGTSGVSIGGSGAASDFTSTSQNLTIQTVSSGTLAVTSAGTLDMDGVAVSIDSSGAMDLTAADGQTLSVNHGGGSTFDIGAAGAVSIGVESGQNLTLDTTSGNIELTTTTAGEIDLTSAALMDLNAGANLDIDVTGTFDMLASSTFSIDGTGASNLTATSGTLTVSTVTSGNVDITAADDINMAAAGSDIDMDAATLTVDMTGAISLDGVGASNFTTDTGALTLSTTTSGDINLTSAANLVVTAVNSTFSGDLRGPNDGTGLIIGHAGAGASQGSAPQMVSLTTTERGYLVPANGMIIYNETDNIFQVYENSSWVNLATGDDVSLDVAYNNGRTITLDAGAVELDTTQTSGVSFDINSVASLAGDMTGASIDLSGVTLNGNNTYGVDINMATGETAIRIQDDNLLAFGDASDATIEYDENGNDRLRFAGANVELNSHLVFGASNTYNIGSLANDATDGYRPAHIYSNTDVVVGSTMTISTDTITASGKLDMSIGGDSAWTASGFTVNLTGTYEVQDNQILGFGNDANFTVTYDEAGADRLAFDGATAPVDTNGYGFRIKGSKGGTYSASAAGLGGAVNINGGVGGDGTGAAAAAVGGNVTITAGAAGTDGGGGGANGGDSSIQAGPGTGAGKAGSVNVGTATTSGVIIGNANASVTCNVDASTAAFKVANGGTDYANLNVGTSTWAFDANLQLLDDHQVNFGTGAADVFFAHNSAGQHVNVNRNGSGYFRLVDDMPLGFGEAGSNAPDASVEWDTGVGTHTWTFATVTGNKPIQIKTGNGSSSIAGQIQLLAGNSDGATNDGGEIDLTTGNGGTASGGSAGGKGGLLDLNAGSGGAGASGGGEVAGAGGNITLNGGNAGADGGVGGAAGGEVRLNGGNATGAANGGAVIINGGTAPGGNKGNIAIGNVTSYDINIGSVAAGTHQVNLICANNASGNVRIAHTTSGDPDMYPLFYMDETGSAGQVGFFAGGAAPSETGHGYEGGLFFDTTNGDLWFWDQADTTWRNVADSGELERFTNGNAGAIAKGDVVYLTSTNNEVDLADADALSTSRVIGIVADTSIASSAVGNFYTKQGAVIKGILVGATAGDPYYLSTTAGDLTALAPSGTGDVVIQVGIAVNATDMLLQISDPVEIA